MYKFIKERIVVMFLKMRSLVWLQCILPRVCSAGYKLHVAKQIGDLL